MSHFIFHENFGLKILFSAFYVLKYKKMTIKTINLIMM